MMRKIYLLFLILLIPISSIFSQCDIFLNTINVSCNGDNDGAIQIIMETGESPFIFNVDGVSYESQDSFFIISNLPEGTYLIEATDANDCEATATAVIDSPFPIFITSTTAVVSCGETACIDIAVTGGLPPYTVSWPNGVIGGTTICENFGPGIYLVIVTDANGCTASADFLVEEGPQLNVTITEEVISCNTSTLTANIIGGAGPYTYLWSDGQVTQSITVSNPDTYSVTVVDINGCAVVINYAYLGDSSFNGNIELVQTNLCGNETNGILTVNADGVPPLTYAWSNGEETATIENLAGGFYQVTVTENQAGSCPLILNFNLQTPGPMDASINVSNIGCLGENSGAIVINVLGGVNPYSYEWVGPNGYFSTDAFIMNLEPGGYSVIVTDANGCTLELNDLLIEEALPLEVTSTTTDVSCAGGSDGSISLQVVNGSGNYSYQWSIGTTGSDVVGLAAGLYSVTVTDGNACFVVHEVSITEATEIVVSITGSTEACTNNGTLEAMVTGGTPPYLYNWYAGLGNTPQIVDLISGYYDITVTDSNGCVAYSSTFISSTIDLDLSSTFADCNSDNGTATASVVSGASDPSYAWSNGESGATITDLSPDWYSVTVTDAASGCIVHNNVRVFEDTICYVLISGYVFADDENQDCMEDDTAIPIGNAMLELSDGQITFTNSNGYYEFETDAGTYTITSTGVNGALEDLCTDPITVVADVWGNQYGGNNFYYKFGEERDIKIKVNKPNARPGFTQHVSICLMNVGAVPVSGTLTYIHPEVQSLSFTNPGYTTYDEATRTITWDYENIPPGAVWIYRPKMYTPIGTPLGTLLEYEFTADPIEGDLTPENNQIVCTEVVTGSYDPNDKAVIPAGIGEEGIISMDDNVLNYRVRFQNTGTDTAFTVIIRDEIDADLDIRTLVPGPSSHSYQVTIKDGNVLELLFENILLPDSFVNEPASNGFVFFDIHVNPDSDYGTRIENTAEIYFDFNEPVITNTVVNTIQMITSNNDLTENPIRLDLSPNPMKDESTLRYSLKESEIVQIKLYDVLGNELKVIQAASIQSQGDHELRIDHLNISEGIYFVRLETKSGISSSLKMLKLE